MANESTKLGISFAHDKIRFIEVEDVADRQKLIGISEVQIPQVFDFSVIGDQTLVPQFADIIQKELENLQCKTPIARVSLDNRLAIKKTFAVDKELSQDDIRGHVEWELEQMLVAPRHEYNVGFEHNKISRAKSNIVIFAAIRKAIVKYIQDIFSKGDLSLQALDLDTFASIRALNHAYADKLKDVCALVDVGHSNVVYTLLVDGIYAFSKEGTHIKNAEQIKDMPAEELAAIAHEELQKLLESLEENLKISSLDRVYLAGDLGTDIIAQELEKLQYPTIVSLAEPFNNIQQQLNIDSQMLIAKMAARFMPCFGMVL